MLDFNTPFMCGSKCSWRLRTENIVIPTKLMKIITQSVTTKYYIKREIGFDTMLNSP